MFSLGKRVRGFINKVDQTIKTGLKRVKTLTNRFGRYVDVANLVLKFGNSIRIQDVLLELEEFKMDYLNRISSLDKPEQEIFKKQLVLENMDRAFILEYLKRKEALFYDKMIETLSKHVSMEFQKRFPEINEEIDLLKEAKETIQEYSILTGEVATLLFDSFGKQILARVDEAKRSYVNKEKFREILEENVYNLFQKVEKFNNMAEVDVQLFTQELLNAIEFSEKQATEYTHYTTLRFGDTFKTEKRMINENIVKNITMLIAFIKIINNISEQIISVDLNEIRKIVNGIYSAYIEFEKILIELKKQRGMMV